MKKQLLLSLFIAIILYASSQASISHSASGVKHNLDISSNSKVSANYNAASFTLYASQVESSQRLVQLTNQITQETPTPTITPPPVKESPTPTHKQRPTSTPIVIPPAASPGATTLMILVGLIAVIVVIVGVWMNRPEK